MSRTNLHGVKMEKRSYTWFEKHRKSKTLVLAREQMTRALGTIALLQKAIVTISKGRMGGAKEHIEKLFLEEEKVDDLRRSVFRELTEHVFMESREDLMHLVKRLDVMADYVKDSARTLNILMETDIPKNILDANIKMVGDLVDCATALRDAIEKLETDPSQVKGLLQKVDSTEHRIDEEYLRTKSLLIKLPEQVGAGTLLILKDLIDNIENAADMCADTADYLKILIR
jgi:predicted phosphate transport protein (TIGR00153 family)